MQRSRIRGWMVVLAACLIASPALAQDSAPASVPFKVKSGAMYATTDVESGERLRVRFKGEGGADVNREAVSLVLEELTQVDGDRTVTVTADGDLERKGRARVYFGTGTATVTGADGDVTFERVRIVVSLRGKGHRLRMLGKYRGIEEVVTAEDEDGVPPDVLRGVIRGRRVKAVESED